ncbi:MAG: insulinase family protein [Chlorobi bacterium]|nr:insulinase family protein [Chlorobiota bacterium]
MTQFHRRHRNILRLIFSNIVGIIAFCHLALATSAPFTAGPDDKQQEFHFPPIVKVQLDNGLTVAVVEKHTVPMVEWRLLINAGALQEKEKQSGLSNLTNNMLLAGTKSRDVFTLSQAFDKLGCTIAPTPDFETSGFRGTVLSEKLPDALSLLADIVLNPSFPERYFTFFKKSFLQQYAARMNDPVSMSSLLFQAKLFGGKHPFGRSLIGDSLSLTSMKLEEVRDFHTVYWTPNNATIILVGDIDAKTAIDLIKDRFGNWKQFPFAAVPQPDFPSPKGVSIMVFEEMLANTSEIRMGNVSISRSSPEFVPTLLLSRILSGEVTSRFQRELQVKRRIPSHLECAFSYRKHGGFFLVSGYSRAISTDTVVTVVLDQLKDIIEHGVGEVELEKAKEGFLEGYIQRFQTSNQILQDVEEILVYNLPEDYFERLPHLIAQTTVEEVQQAAQVALDPDRMQVIIIGNVEKFAKRLVKQFGKRVKVFRKVEAK